MMCLHELNNMNNISYFRICEQENGIEKNKRYR